MKQHTKPCRACPWRKDSPRGWLGDAAPIEFLETAEAEVRMPCHLHVDYEREDWRDAAEIAPQCAGRAVYFANRCKKPINPALIQLAPDRDEIFGNPQDFLDHHTPREQAARIRLITGLGIVTDQDIAK